MNVHRGISTNKRHWKFICLCICFWNEDSLWFPWFVLWIRVNGYWLCWKLRAYVYLYTEHGSYLVVKCPHNIKWLVHTYIGSWYPCCLNLDINTSHTPTLKAVCEPDTVMSNIIDELRHIYITTVKNKNIVK